MIALAEVQHMVGLADPLKTVLSLQQQPMQQQAIPAPYMSSTPILGMPRFLALLCGTHMDLNENVRRAAHFLCCCCACLTFAQT